jgi:uroporphyrinogen-III synthase
MAPLALLTRPRSDSEALAEALRELGIDSLIDPVIEIRPLAGAQVPELDDIQALLITSANGVRALAEMLGPPPAARHITLLAVGAASGEAARAAGFKNVRSADGDVAALADLARECLDPEAGPLLHIAGSKVAGDLAGDLARDGFEVRRECLYEARKSEALANETLAALADGEIAMVLIFSPRSARAFDTLVRAAALDSALAGATAICLSKPVADAAAALPWRRIRTARKPEQAALLDEVAQEIDMADKNKRNKAKPPREARGEKAAAEEARGEARLLADPRRRLPLAAFALLLLLIAVGVYFAWPEIQGGIDNAPRETVVATAEPEHEPAPVPESAPEAAPEPESALEPAPEADPEPAPAAAPDAALVALSEQVAALERALAEQAAALESAQAELAARPAEAAEVPQPDFAPLEAAMTRLADMETRLGEAQSAAEAAIAAAAASGTEIAAGATDFRTIERLDDMEAALAELKAGGAAVDIDALRAAQESLRDEIAALRQSFESAGRREAESGRTMLLVLSHSALMRAAAGPEPFTREIEAFRAAVRAEGAPGIALEKAIAQLADHALSGTPTLSQLAAGFDDAALAVVRADADAEDQDWVDATIGRLRNIVTVRRVSGDVAADSLEGRLAALHRALAGGDLAAAIALGEALPAKARHGAEEWLTRARARLAVETALSQLDSELAARVAARWMAEERRGE